MTSKAQNDIRQILTTASTVTVNRVIQIVGSLVTVPLLLRAVGQEDYGVLVLATLLLGYIRLMTFGTPTAIRNRVSGSYAAGRVGDINQLISVLQIIYLVLFAASLVVVVTVCFGTPGIIHLLIRDHTQPNVLPMTLLFLFTMGLVNTFLGSIYTNIFHGIDCIDTLTRFESATAIVQTVVFIIFLIPRPNIVHVAMFYFAASVVIVVARYVLLRSALPGFRLVGPRRVLATLATIRNSGASFAILSFLQVVQETSITLLISALYAVAPLAIYNIANKLFFYIAAAWPIAFATWPKVTRLHQQGNLDGLRVLFDDVLRLNVKTKTVFFVPMAIFGADLITLWLGSDMAGSPWLYFLLMCLWITNTLTGTMSSFILGMSLERKLILPNVFFAVIRIVLMVVLFYIWRQGVESFVAGTLITQMFYLTVLSGIVSDQLTIRVYRLMLHHLWKIAVLGALLAVAHTAVIQLDLTGRSHYTVDLVLGVMYLASAYRWVCTPTERQRITAIVSNRSFRFTASGATG